MRFIFKNISHGFSWNLKLRVSSLLIDLRGFKQIIIGNQIQDIPIELPLKVPMYFIFMFSSIFYKSFFYLLIIIYIYIIIFK